MPAGDNILALKAQLPPDVTLVAVSKFHGPEAIMDAYGAGQRDFGENRPQEFAAKCPALPEDIRWHFIGHLQTNKLRLVLPYADLVQSVDSQHLLSAISRWAVENGRTVCVLLELHLGSEQTKGGLSADEIRGILSRPADFPGVRFRGLMGMATNTSDEAVIDAEFALIAGLRRELAPLAPRPEDFTELSIGMSGDWKIALRHGATIVRIGTSIFGPREY